MKKFIALIVLLQLGIIAGANENSSKLLIVMNKIIFSLLLLMSFNLFSQDFKIFERVTNDKFPIHCCYHSVETSSSDIILAEACCDYINGALGNTGMNLFKLNRDMKLTDSVFVEFVAGMYMPFVKNPSEDNYVLSGFYLNDEDDMYHYDAILVDDDLNVTKEIDVPILPSGLFSSIYRTLFYDGDFIIVCKVEPDYYVYLRMDIYGNVKTLKLSYLEDEIIPDYANMRLQEYPLFVYNTNPLQYGCLLSNVTVSDSGVIISEGDLTILLMDSEFNVFEIKDNIRNENYYYAPSHIHKIISSKDGGIIMFSCMNNFNEQMKTMQVVKYDKNFNVIAYQNIGDMVHIGSYPYCEADNNGIIECEDGSLYVKWKILSENHTEKKVVTYLDKDLNIVWERAFYECYSLMPVLYGNMLLSDGGLALAGYGDGGYDYSLVAVVFDNKSISVGEHSDYLRPYIFYPNPAADVVNIRFSPDVTAEKVEIYGMDGRLYHEQNFNMETVNVNDLSSGVYMMKLLMDNGETFTEKIVIK